MTDTTGCGGIESPWIITAMSGQTIDLAIIDFGSEMLKKSNSSSSFPIYGYVLDDKEKVAIKGGMERERDLLTSKTSKLSVEIVRKSSRESTPGFILHFISKCYTILYKVHWLFIFCIDIFMYNFNVKKTLT